MSLAEAPVETLGQRIRRLRQERAMSLAQVAGPDFSRAFLNQVEGGRSQPSTRVLRVIAARLGTPVEYLLTGTAPTLQAEIALERARISLAKGQLRKALALLDPLLDATEWPLAADVRLAAAEALSRAGRHAEAEQLLAAAARLISKRGDELRAKRLATIRGGKPARLSGSACTALAERALRRGDPAAALELFRTARVLLESAPARAPAESRTSAADRRPAGSPRV